MTATGRLDAELIVVTNDPDQMSLSIPLVGFGAAADILVQPTELVFGDSPLADILPPGLGSTRGFGIFNIGTVNVTLASSSFEIRDADGTGISTDFTLQESTGVAVPIQDRALLAGDMLSLAVLFRPQTLGEKNGVITITYSGHGVAGSFDVVMQGRGIDVTF